jgi:4'-phosphopantetheinyl transferase EntD
VSKHPQSGPAAAANPATDSPLAASLFPAEVSAAELRSPGDPGMLEPEEAVAVARAVAKRVGEFAAGRLCARRALERFGLTGVRIPAASDRQPVWPSGFAGSITHTAGFCAAVVGKRDDFRGLGLDTEIADAVKPELWSSICVPAELEWIGRWPAHARPLAAALVFSAKEAFYKAQYPITGEFMSFADLEVAPADSSALQGTLAILPTRILRLAESFEGACRFEAAYRFHEEFVSSGVALAV